MDYLSGVLSATGGGSSAVGGGHSSASGGGGSLSTGNSPNRTGQVSSSLSTQAASSKRRTIRSQQIDAVIRMLHFNREPAAVTAGSSLTGSGGGGGGMVTGSSGSGGVDDSLVWKVLVYDQFGQEVIGPLLKVSELREHGITVHMLLHANRQPIEDAPAIYFVAPTQENIARISDVTIVNRHPKGLYDSFYINFSSTLSRELLEQLATSTISSNSYQLVSQVFDQYLNFLSPESQMFSLNIPDSYRKINDPRTSDSAMEQILDQIANSLLSVLVTAGVLPIIRCTRGNAAEQVARKLDSRLRDRVINIRGDGYMEAASSAQASRPLLVLLDRSIDLSSMLSHTWSYQGLVHDVLEIKSNRIFLSMEERGKMVRKNYDLDVNDYLWERNAGSLFQDVTEDLNVELTQYKKETEEITRSAGVTSLDEIASMDVMSSATILKKAISALPRLTEKKRLIDMHMNIASALLDKIKDRSLDSYILAEESLSKQTKATLTEVFKGSGTAEDKMRLFLVHYLSMVNEMPKEEIAEFENILRQVGCDLGALEYAKSVRNIARMTAMANANFQANAAAAGGYKSSNILLDRFSSIGGRIADNLQNSGITSTFDNIISGVRNILPSAKSLPVTRITESLLNSSSGSSSGLGLNNASPDDEYLYFDPKVVRGGPQRALKGTKVTFQDAIVFVVGGGNYIEYQNLQELAKRLGSGRNVMYGSTEIINADAFLKQMSALVAKQ